MSLKSSADKVRLRLQPDCVALTRQWAGLGWAGLGGLLYVRLMHVSETSNGFAHFAWVQIAVATLSGNSLWQTVHTHRASVHQAAKLVAALSRVAGVTAGLAESNGSLPSGL